MVDSSKPQVLIIGPTEFLKNTSKYQEFCSKFEVLSIQPKTSEELIEAFQTSLKDVQGIFNSMDGIWALGGPNKFIDHFPSGVKVFAYPWVGHDSVDGEKLRSRGIALCNVGSVSSALVADIALYLTLSVFRMMPIVEKTFRDTGDFQKPREFIGGQLLDSAGLPEKVDKKHSVTNFTIAGKQILSPLGKTAGIVGLGSIGKEIAKRLWAIGMDIQYTKRTPLTEQEELQLPYKVKYFQNFTEMIKDCDLIVFAVPHSPTTRHFINLETIKLCKKGVRIVNIGRGSAIDENVLLELLDNGTVASCGLDVFENEPNNVDPRFLNRWDVVMTPHIGSHTNDNHIQCHEMCMSNIENVVLDNGPGLYPVN